MNVASSSVKLCYLSPFLYLINLRKVTIAEDELYGLIQGITFEYSYIHDNQKVEHPVSKDDSISLIGSESDIIPIINRYFPTTFSKEIHSPVNALERINERLWAGEPIICHVDVYHLPYHPQYRKRHGLTQIILLRQATKEDYWFRDCYIPTIPTTQFEGIVSGNLLGEALFVNEMRESIIYLCHFSGENSKDVVSRIEYMNHLVQNCNKMLHPKHRFAGTQGIISVSEEIDRVWRGLWGSERMEQVFQQAYFHINTKGGPAISRKVFANYLNRLGQWERNQYGFLSQLANHFHEVSGWWKVLSSSFFRGSLNNPHDYLPKISAQLLKLGKREGELFEELLSMLQTSDYY